MNLKSIGLGSLIIAVSVLTGVAHAAEENAETKDERVCFRVKNINDWRFVDKDHVDVRAGVNRWYRLEVTGNARSLRFNQGIAFKARGVGSFVCSNDPWSADITPTDAFGHPDRISFPLQVRGFKKIPKENAGLTDAEIAERDEGQTS